MLSNLCVPVSVIDFGQSPERPLDPGSVTVTDVSRRTAELEIALSLITGLSQLRKSWGSGISIVALFRRCIITILYDGQLSAKHPTSPTAQPSMFSFLSFLDVDWPALVPKLNGI